jgi:protein TonB
MERAPHTGALSPVQARPNPQRTLLKDKSKVVMRRAAPPEERTMKHPQKIRIAQKPHSQVTPSAPPTPKPQLRVATATRLSPPEPSSPMPPSRSPQAGESRLRLETHPRPVGRGDQEGAAGPFSPSGSPLLIAKADPHRGGDRDARLEAIRRLIQKALVYPQAARRFGWEGTARVRFALGPDGRPSEVTLESSSQMAILDQEALAAVRRAAPYPYLKGAIVVPIVFDIRAPSSRIIPGGK